jgi:glycosyltransferase involved in cell wall biosynthesis
MSVVFIGGVYGDEYEPDVMKNTKDSVDNSANIFQKKLLSGFLKITDDIKIFSAPLIAAFPKYYKKMYFKPYAKDSKIHYVGFNNLWGYKNISRSHALKKAIKKNLNKDDENLEVVVYCTHTPFLKAAKYIKKHYKNAKVTLIVLDLPQFMVLGRKKTLIYRFCKYFDIKTIYGLCRFVDSYVVLTDQMLDVLPDGRSKRSMVAEGICENVEEFKEKVSEKKTILYAGKLHESFGVMNLINAFLMLDRKDIELVICGGGELSGEIAKIAEENENIIFKGQLSESEAKKMVLEADVLVNPRLNSEEFKYSFPSKNIEYLASGNPVVAYKLYGMPDVYKDFIYMPKDNSIKALSEAVESAIDALVEDRKAKYEPMAKCIKENLYAENVCRKILALRRE